MQKIHFAPCGLFTVTSNCDVLYCEPLQQGHLK
nr:MAG TPA: hypothetical protein [Caudoviricetes sp.]